MNRLGLQRSAALMRAFLARHAIPVRSPLLEGFWEHSTQRAETLACIARHLPGNIDGDVPVVISSPFGHDAFLIEDALVATELRRILAS